MEFGGSGAGLHKGISCQTRVAMAELVSSTQHPGSLGKKENMKIVFCTHRITPVSTTTK